MRRSLQMLCVLVVSIGLAGCGDDGAPSSSDLAGRTFLSDSIVDDNQPLTLVAGTRIRLAFEHTSLSVSGGCNTGGGDYAIENGRIVTDAVAMTEMACDDDRMAQDDWILAVLGEHPTVTLDGDRLTLRTDTVTVEMLDREVADPQRPLIGTVWQATTLIDEQGASNIPDLADAQVVFDPAGTVAVATSCNTGGATYLVDGTTITFGPLTLTEIACDEPRAGIETHIVSVLHGEVTFAVDASSLTLMRGDLGLGLSAVGR